MKVTEIFDLLAIINSFIPSFDPKDERKVKSWQRVLGEKMTYSEAERYLYEHFETSRYIPLPADLLKRKPRSISPFTITNEEREHLGDVYRKQRERNARDRGTVGEFSKGPDAVPSEQASSDG